jgi:hypothetical protein
MVNVFNITLMQLGSITGNFNLNMMLKIEFYKMKNTNGLIKHIKSLYIMVRTPYNSPIQK